MLIQDYKFNYDEVHKVNCYESSTDSLEKVDLVE